MLNGDREGVEAPDWFSFGRDLLVNAAQTAADAGSSINAQAASAPGAESRASPDQTLHEAFEASLSNPTPFATIVANAGLSIGEAEVLAVLAAAEADRHCQQLVASIQGDARSGQLTLGTIGDIFDQGHIGSLALGPESRLRRAALVDVAVAGPWAGHVIELHRGVVWALVGDLSPDPDLPDDIESHDSTADPAEASAVDDQATRDLVVVNGSDPMRCRH